MVSPAAPRHYFVLSPYALHCVGLGGLCATRPTGQFCPCFVTLLGLRAWCWPALLVAALVG